MSPDLRTALALLCLVILPSAPRSFAESASGINAIISVADQQLRIMDGDRIIAQFPVSTSKFGLGDSFNSFRTPLGRFEVAQRIGHDVPIGGKFHRRNFTGIVYNVRDKRIEKKERDSILTRIIWLRGLEPHNRNAYHRGIYIHGTNQESLVGKPVSYGCIRMRNQDVVQVFEILPEGSLIVIQRDPLPKPPRRRALERPTEVDNTPTESSPPVVAPNARLVASASERGAPPPTILRANADSAPSIANQSNSRPPSPSDRRSNIVASKSASAAVTSDSISLDEGWVLDAFAQRRTSESNTQKANQ